MGACIRAQAWRWRKSAAWLLFLLSTMGAHTSKLLSEGPCMASEAAGPGSHSLCPSSCSIRASGHQRASNLPRIGARDATPGAGFGSRRSPAWVAPAASSELAGRSSISAARWPRRGLEPLRATRKDLHLQGASSAQLRPRRGAVRVRMSGDRGKDGGEEDAGGGSKREWLLAKMFPPGTNARQSGAYPFPGGRGRRQAPPVLPGGGDAIQ